jgi:molybdopterin/thiamine biosynthesis adenylyltransferase
VLCEKIKKINPKIETEAIIGHVCDENNGKECINKEWFSKNKSKYAIIFGCMDGGLARVILNQHCTELGLNYVDGGSSPRQGKAVAFVPGQTVCLECAIKISNEVDVIRNSCGGTVKVRGDDSAIINRPVDGNVNMSNRAVAGLMLSEARKIINPELGPAWKGFVLYANNGQGLLPLPDKSTCPHYKNDTK